jgi:hypothetical protein
MANAGMWPEFTMRENEKAFRSTSLFTLDVDTLTHSFAGNPGPTAYYNKPKDGFTIERYREWLQCIKTLYIKHCSALELPQYVISSTHRLLVEVNIHSCLGIQSVPTSLFTDLLNVRTISIQFCAKLIHLPDTISSSTLQQLIMHSNQSLQNLAANKLDCPNLQALQFSGNTKLTNIFGSGMLQRKKGVAFA